MAVIKKSLTTDTSGDATTTFNVNDYIDTIAIDYSASADAGTDTTITGYLGGSSFTIYSKTDSNTDVVVRPRVKVQSNAGTDVEYASNYPIYEKYMVDRVTITFAQGGSTKTNLVVIGIDRSY